jgi:hypothetical protein
MRQVRRRPARRDALAHQCLGANLFVGREFALRLFFQRFQRQPQRPKHQPRRFVEGVGRAMAKRNARLFEAGALRGDEVDELHVSNLCRVSR